MKMRQRRRAALCRPVYRLFTTWDLGRLGGDRTVFAEFVRRSSKTMLVGAWVHRQCLQKRVDPFLP